ncbi:MAG: hypothetical protein KatS3mg035_1167 [Bacteroidia bacterium]|nr:MAG: hypothetical protein KatS3mg035_1167 [Bacteroidia bacterium]
MEMKENFKFCYLIWFSSVYLTLSIHVNSEGMSSVSKIAIIEGKNKNNGN